MTLFGVDILLALSSLAGIPFYIIVIWFIWSNAKDAGKTELTFKKRLYYERQELVLTTIGALVFAFSGEGILDSVCDGVDYALGTKAHDFCTSVQVNTMGLFYFIGGSSFGTVGLFLVKYIKGRAKKKLNEIS